MKNGGDTKCSEEEEGKLAEEVQRTNDKESKDRRCGATYFKTTG